MKIGKRKWNRREEFYRRLIESRIKKIFYFLTTIEIDESIWFVVGSSCGRFGYPAKPKK